MSLVFCSINNFWIFRSSTFHHDMLLPISFYNNKKVSLYKPVYKNLFLIKNFYLLDTFLSGFLLKPKLKKSFLCFCFDIYFKINLVLLLGFEVVHAKNCIRKILNLRYYATFKVRKFESLFYKINTFLQKITTCIGLQTEQILYVNI